VVKTWSSHQFTKLKDASPQGRAHAQSPGNPVELLWLDESHDVIQTRIHDEMSQPLCLTPTQFGNFEVLRVQRDALRTTNDVLHRKVTQSYIPVSGPPPILEGRAVGRK
jgi:hypothetical protein